MTKKKRKILIVLPEYEFGGEELIGRPAAFGRAGNRS